MKYKDLIEWISCNILYLFYDEIDIYLNMQKIAVDLFYIIKYVCKLSSQ